MKHSYSAVPHAHLRTAELLLDERDLIVLQICAEHLQTSLLVALRYLYDIAGLPYLEGWDVVDFLANARPDQLCVDQITLDKVASYSRTIRHVHEDLGRVEDAKVEATRLQGLALQVAPILAQLQQGFERIRAARAETVLGGSKRLDLQ